MSSDLEIPGHARQPPVRLLSYNIAGLHFDPLNPRLPAGVDGEDDAAVLRWMVLDATLLDLMGSIAEHGFFQGEPILIVPRPTTDYYVVEGNRRLAAVRLLRNPRLAPVRRSHVQELADSSVELSEYMSAVQFPDRNDILDYLGFRHITGVKEWDPLAKARYLRQLWDRTPGDNDQRLRILARKIGSQPYYVRRLLGGLRIFDTIERADFYSIEGLDDNSLSFSLLSTALSFDSLNEFVGMPEDPTEEAPLHEDNVEKLTRWTFETQPDGGTVLGDSRNMKTLAAVVEKPQALSLLEQGATLAEAVLATEHLGNQFSRYLRQARDRLDAAQRLLRRVNAPTEADSEILSEIIAAAGDLRVSIRRRTQS